MEPLIDGKNNW